MVEPLNTKASQAALDALGTGKANQLEPDLRIAVSAYISALPSLAVVDGGEIVAWFGQYEGKSRIGFDQSVALTEPLVRQSDLRAAATLITTQQQEIERLTKERDEAQAEIERMTPKFVAYDYLESPAGREIAESRVLSLEETLRRISAIKYPSADTKYALRATIDYARDQARAALKENGNG